jgi:hypothetical protein
MGGLFGDFNGSKNWVRFLFVEGQGVMGYKRLLVFGFDTVGVRVYNRRNSLIGYFCQV